MEEVEITRCHDCIYWTQYDIPFWVPDEVTERNFGVCERMASSVQSPDTANTKAYSLDREGYWAIGITHNTFGCTEGESAL